MIHLRKLVSGGCNEPQGDDRLGHPPGAKRWNIGMHLSLGEKVGTARRILRPARENAWLQDDVI